MGKVSIEDAPAHHCCSRVSRRAFLFGDDRYTGKNYAHRQGRVESQLFNLGSFLQ
ncbi:transposase [Shewanella hanedai]|uniref:Transposase n=1 Tax=Shewanella hanedai TaxID=25 RepID=A0A553JVA4_SHEHA|nr:transposase [Shewanella hanedai]